MYWSLALRGAGKGSVSVPIKEKYKLTHISVGDIIREESKKENNKVKPYMSKGSLVPDGLVMDLVGERLAQDDCKNGFILDGFPRTITQAEYLKNNKVRIDYVINLQVSEENIVDRLSNRRMDPITKKIYNPKTIGLPEGVDETTLVQRDDDKPEVIKKRIEVYKEQTEPLIHYYQDQGILKNVDADPPLDKVIENVLAVFKDKAE